MRKRALLRAPKAIGRFTIRLPNGVYCRLTSQLASNANGQQQFSFWIKSALRYPIEGRMPSLRRGIPRREGVPPSNSRSVWRFRRQGILTAKRSPAKMRVAGWSAVVQFDSRPHRDSVESGTPSLRGSHLKWAPRSGARASCPRSDAGQSASRSSPAKGKPSHYQMVASSHSEGWQPSRSVARKLEMPSIGKPGPDLIQNMNS